MFRIVYHELSGPQLSGQNVGNIHRRALPRWLVLAMVVAVVLPLLILGAIFLSVVVVAALALAAAVIAVLAVRIGWRRLRGSLKGDGRRNVRLARRPPAGGF